MNTNNTSKTRILFTKEEDDLIKHLYEDIGIKDWNKISQYLPNRSAKNCQDRYINYLRPNLKAGNWTKEEDDHFLKLVEKYGKKWTIISEHLPGRSPVSLKSRFAKCVKNKIDQIIYFPTEQKSRIARLVLPSDFEEKKSMEFPTHPEIENLFEQVFRNEFNAFNFAFDDF
jgi:hypothetical protein